MTSERSIANGVRLWSQTQPPHVALAGSVGDFGRAAAGALHTYLFGVSPNFSLSPRGTTGGRVGEGGVRALLGDAPPLPGPLLPQGRRGRRDKGESLNRYSHTAAIQRTGFVVRCFVIAAFLAVALLAGCAVGPDYQRPAALAGNPMPAAFGVPQRSPTWSRPVQRRKRPGRTSSRRSTGRLRLQDNARAQTHHQPVRRQERA